MSNIAELIDDAVKGDPSLPDWNAFANVWNAVNSNSAYVKEVVECIRKIIKHGKEDSKRLLAVSLLSSLTTSCAVAAPEIGGKNMQETLKKLVTSKSISNELREKLLKFIQLGKSTYGEQYLFASTYVSLKKQGIEFPHHTKINSNSNFSNNSSKNSTNSSNGSGSVLPSTTNNSKKSEDDIPEAEMAVYVDGALNNCQLLQEMMKNNAGVLTGSVLKSHTSECLKNLTRIRNFLQYDRSSEFTMRLLTANEVLKKMLTTLENWPKQPKAPNDPITAPKKSSETPKISQSPKQTSEIPKVSQSSKQTSENPKISKQTSETPKVSQSPKQNHRTEHQRPTSPNPVEISMNFQSEPPNNNHHETYSRSPAPNENLYSHAPAPISKTTSRERLHNITPQGSEENLYNMLSIDSDRGRSTPKLGGDKVDPKRTVRVLDPSFQNMWENSKEDSNFSDLIEEPSRWLIQNKDIIIREKIGEGYFSIVYRGKWRNSNVAVKKYRYDKIIRVAIKELKEDIVKLLGLRTHANVAAFLGICLGPLAIIWEYSQRTDLWSYLLTHRVIPENVKSKWASAIAAGMRHLHDEGIIHRHLASRNIMLTNDLEPKISDYGLNHALSSSFSSPDQNPYARWMSPETILFNEHSTKSDVWSYGVVIYEIETGQEPFFVEITLEVLRFIAEGKLRLCLRPHSGARMRQLMEICMKVDKYSRPEFSKLCDQTNAWEYEIVQNFQ